MCQFHDHRDRAQVDIDTLPRDRAGRLTNPDGWLYAGTVTK